MSGTGEAGFANEFEIEDYRDGMIRLTFIVFEPDGLGGNVRTVICRKLMPAAGYARSVNGGPLACARVCDRRLKPLENRSEDTFSTA